MRGSCGHIHERDLDLPDDHDRQIRASLAVGYRKVADLSPVQRGQVPKVTPSIVGQIRAILDRLPSAEAAVLSSALETRSDRRRRRDNAIRAARIHYGGLTSSRAAKELAADISRHASGAWLRAQRQAVPAAQPDSRLQSVHTIVHLNDGLALGWRQILDILEN